MPPHTKGLGSAFQPRTAAANQSYVADGTGSYIYKIDDNENKVVGKSSATVSDDDRDLFEAVKSGAEGDLLKEAEGRGSAREGLSNREQEVLQLAARGATNREIAHALFISENTVHLHMKNILAKLHLRNRTEVIAWAFEHGLLWGAGDLQTLAPP